MKVGNVPGFLNCPMKTSECLLSHENVSHTSCHCAQCVCRELKWK